MYALHRGVVVAAALLVASALPANGEQADAGSVALVDAVVASIDGTPITLVDLEEFERGAGRLLPSDERETRAALLDAMVLTRLFQAEFDKNGIKASDADVERYIDNIVAESHSSREGIQRALSQIGATWPQYFERQRQELQRMALLNREIRARVNVTPEEIERAWREDPQYATGERMEIAQILIPAGSSSEQHEQARVRADEAYEAARRNFAKAAKTYSEGPDADKGGILGSFERGEMAASFATALEGLEPGDVAPPFEADGAYHIVKLVRIVPADRKPLEEVRGAIEEQLYGEILQSRFRRWIDEDLRKRHHITMQLDDLDTLVNASAS